MKTETTEAGGWTPVKAPEGALIDPKTGCLVAIIQDAAQICGLSTSTISRLASEGQIRRFTRYVVLEDIRAIKPKLRGPGRPPGDAAKAIWQKYHAMNEAGAFKGIEL